MNIFNIISLYIPILFLERLSLTCPLFSRARKLIIKQLGSNKANQPNSSYLAAKPQTCGYHRNDIRRFAVFFI